MSFLAEYESFRARLSEAVETALLTHVAPAVKEEMQAQVYDKVYAAYDPTQYERRYDEGGLADTRNMEAFVDSGEMTLHVVNITRSGDGTGRLVAPVVERGTGYEWLKSEIYAMQPFPRPFTEPTEQEVMRDGTAERELAQGLREQGFEVEETV